MRRSTLVLALALTGFAAARAQAGETACWIDNGAVVAPAAFGDIAGDFLFDLSAAHSVLHLTRAQGAGIVTPQAEATLRLAGERIPARFAVASLDARSWGFPTTINGLIGADVLAGYVVELRFSPCELRLSRRAPAVSRAAIRLPVAMVEGVPTVLASITDGRTGALGRFAIDTGTGAVRLSEAVARLSRSPKGLDPLARDKPPARLAALSLGPTVYRNLPASLETDLPAALAGGIGDDVWSRYALVLDLRRDELELDAGAQAQAEAQAQWATLRQILR